MASFRIHEDQENNSTVLRKENTDMFGAVQRRALGDLNHYACSQNRNTKQTSMTNGLCKVQDENRTVRQIKNDKNILPPVAQFRAFSVYEDNPTTETEVKKREPTFKPFVPKEVKKDNFFQNAAENIKALCAQLEKPLDRPKEALARIPLQEKKDKDVVESPMSVVDSSMLSMSVSQYESTILEDTIHEVDDKAKIKRDIDIFFHVAEYQKDIYAYMREIEVKHRPNPRYMRKQPDISQMMRSILVDWLVEVCDEYSQQSETLHLAVSYVDRFLSYMSVVRTKLQLVGTAATYIAAKYEEVFPPEVSEFVYITDDTYTKREVLRMEHLILKVLSFDLSTPTSLAFISHICIAANIPKKTKNLAAYIAELCLLEGDTYLQFLPSTIASAALATALHCVTEHECAAESAGESAGECAVECERVSWPCTLRRYTGYRFADLTPCMRELARTHKHALLQPYHSILDKYKNNKFDSVSTLEPRPMFPVGRYVAPAPAPQRPQPQPNSRALS